MRAAGAGITGFYMTRLMLMTFFGDKSRWESDVHPHESPKVMTVPLIVLAALSVLGGVLLLGDFVVEFLAPVTGVAEHHEPPLPADRRSRCSSWRVVAVGVAAAWFLVGKQRRSPGRLRPTSRSRRAPPVPTCTATRSTRAWSWPPGRPLTTGLASFDRFGVDGVVEGGSAGVGARLRVSCAASRTASSAPMPSPCSAARSSSSWPCWR